MYLSIDELDREVYDPIVPFCCMGTAHFCLHGVCGVEEYSSFGVVGELRVYVDLDIHRMDLSCRVPIGDYYFSIDPAAVSYVVATYKGKRFRDTLKTLFNEECAIARGGLLANRALAFYDYDIGCLPDGISDHEFEWAVEEAYGRLCPQGKVICLKRDERFGFREEGRNPLPNPYRDYLFHRELQLVAPRLDVAKWLPETSRNECQALIGVVDQGGMVK